MANHAALREVENLLKEAQQLDGKVKSDLQKLNEAQRQANKTKRNVQAAYQEVYAEISNLARAQHDGLTTQQELEAVGGDIEKERHSLELIRARGEKATLLATTSSAPNWTLSDTLSLAALQEQFRQADEKVRQSLKSLSTSSPFVSQLDKFWQNIAQSIVLFEEAHEMTEQEVGAEESMIDPVVNNAETEAQLPLPKEQRRERKTT